MKRTQQKLIELGAVSAETKGGPVGYEDQERTFILKLGLTND
jgi:hypothetical protein